MSYCTHYDKTKVHRLPILVAHRNITKLLAVPKLNLGKAYIKAKVVFSEVYR